MRVEDCHHAIRSIVQSAIDQGCTILNVRFDPEGGWANQGHLIIDVEKDGKKLQNAGSGMINNEGEFEWLLRSSGPTPQVVEPLPNKTGPVDFQEFDRTLRLFAVLNNVAKVGILLMPLMKRDKAITFVMVEKRLRELGSRIYILAAPLSQMTPNMPPGTRPEHQHSEEPAKYWVWFCLHGPDEAARMRDVFDIPTPEENLTRLRDTGFLTLPKDA